MLNRAFSGAVARVAALLSLLVALESCGFIANKDRIQIAVLNGKPITRGDFDKVIRDMPPGERPLIRTKGDVRKALQNYLDTEVRNKNAKDLLDQKKIFVPREIAATVLRMNKPELFIEMQNPEDYNWNEKDVAYMKEETQIQIDAMWEKLQAEAGVQYRIEQAMKEGLVTITDKEYEDEFAVRQGELKHFERVAFNGILVPGGSPEVRAAGTAIRNKLHANAAVADLVKEFEGVKAQSIESELENDPKKYKYASFWEQATKAKVGDVVGPIAIKGWVAAETDAQGKTVEKPYPDGVLVCVVTGRTDETPKTLEESKTDLQYNILYSKIMEQLRTENGVQVFEDKLPDPGVYDSSIMKN